MVLWLFGLHGPEQASEAIKELERLSKIYDEIYLVSEQMPSKPENLALPSEVVRQIRSNPDSLEDASVRAEIEEALKLYREKPERGVAQFKDAIRRGMSAEAIRQRIEGSAARPDPVLPVLLYVAQNEKIHIVSEKVPLDAVLDWFRSGFSLQRAVRKLYEEADEQGFRKEMVECYVREITSDDARDRALSEIVQGLMKAHSKAAIVIPRGRRHVRAAGMIGEYGLFKSDVRIPSDVLAYPLHQALDPYRNELLRGKSVPRNDPKIERALLSHLPWMALSAILVRGGMGDREARKLTVEILGKMDPGTVHMLIRSTQKYAYLFRRGKGAEDVDFWLGNFTLYTTAWLRDHGYLSPHVEEKLPPALQGLSIPKAIETLQRSGLEEPQALSGRRPGGEGRLEVETPVEIPKELEAELIGHLEEVLQGLQPEEVDFEELVIEMERSGRLNGVKYRLYEFIHWDLDGNSRTPELQEDLLRSIREAEVFYRIQIPTADTFITPSFLFVDADFSARLDPKITGFIPTELLMHPSEAVSLEAAQAQAAEKLKLAGPKTLVLLNEKYVFEGTGRQWVPNSDVPVVVLSEALAETLTLKHLRDLRAAALIQLDLVVDLRKIRKIRFEEIAEETEIRLYV